AHHQPPSEHLQPAPAVHGDGHSGDHGDPVLSLVRGGDRSCSGEMSRLSQRLVDGAAEAEGHRSTSAWARDGLLRLAEEVQSMKRRNTAEEPVIDEASEVELTDLELVSAGSQSKIGTLSFPVRGKPIYAPISDNTDLIVEVIKKRQPAL